jgi:hypothetical protein
MENKKNWAEQLAEILTKTETENICLGMEIAELKKSYYYDELIKFLKGGTGNGNLYFEKLKPLYDKYGYEKVNRILLSLEEEKAEEKGAENE